MTQLENGESFDRLLLKLVPSKYATRLNRLTRECANNVDGACTKCDGTTCPQRLSRVLVCRHFVESVLPDDAELVAALASDNIAARSTTVCKVCGAHFKASSNAQKYCKDCQHRAYVKAQRERRRNHK